MKKIVILGLGLFVFMNMHAQDNIAAARALGVGQTVTITGIVTNGSELGPIRYMQDESAGIAVYSTLLSDVKRGDEVTLTGVIKDYSSLLEIDPVSSLTVNSSGNELPAPIVITPSQQSEAYEAMLVRIDNVEFDASGVFERTSYTYTAGDEAGQIYINSTDSPLMGTVIPTNTISVVGPLGAYSSTFQILPRDQFDLLSSSVINLTKVPAMSNLSTSGFSIDWETDSEGTTEAFYGNTPALELGKISVPGTSLTHLLDISGLSASELIYIQPFSVKDADTARAAVQVYITQSESSGNMKAYFNRTISNTESVAPVEVAYLERAIDDTLISYIDRATESIDFTIYNFNNNGISNISAALNAAYDRGVDVRVIYDGNTDNLGIDALNAGIGKIASPKSEYPIYGIMHNKFVIFDANSSDPDLPIVWTGATNFTDGQINTDPNNVVIVQDKSLAIAFQLEFNEMFGSDGLQPDAALAKFGPDKADNTPHEFLVNGSRIECYFSPSDGTHTKILDVIESADHSIHIATMLITKTDIGYDLADKNDAGLDVKVLIKDFDQYGEPIVNTLKASLEDDIRVAGEGGIMHHKYMIVDKDYPDSDPTLLTGSHNWSSSAQFRNDENTLIIHNQNVAKAYYFDFINRFTNGLLVVPKPECSNDFVTMYGGSSFRYDVLYNDEIPGPVNVSISRQPSNGSARVEDDNTITYVPDPGFNQAIDTVAYQVCLSNSTGICDSAIFVIYVNKPVSIDGFQAGEHLSIYPNPATEMLTVSADPEYLLHNVFLIDQSGRVVRTFEFDGEPNVTLPVADIYPGIYFLKMEFEDGSLIRKVAIQ